MGVPFAGFAETEKAAVEAAVEAKKPESEAGKGALESSIAPAVAIGSRFGFSGMLGASVGYSAKKAGKAGAVVIGGVVVGLQVLAYNDYIDVNWMKIESEAIAAADQNGDGILDSKDATILMKRSGRVLSTGFGPCAGGFTTGLIYGLQAG